MNHPSDLKLYSRSAMRVRHTIPAELADSVGKFLLKVEILDISPLAVRLYCNKPSLLAVGRKLTISLWNNTRTRATANHFSLPVTVMARRGEGEFIVVFDEPQSPDIKRLEGFVYGPVLLEALVGHSEQPPATLDELKRASLHFFGATADLPLDAGLELRQRLKANAYLFRTFLAGRQGAVRAALSLRVATAD